MNKIYTKLNGIFYVLAFTGCGLFWYEIFNGRGCCDEECRRNGGDDQGTEDKIILCLS
ncbi:hypothetical protein LQZ18_06970 [Lachnospiraceae bacterium ZAX-1]